MNSLVRSKLFELKEYLTLPDAAKHLSGVCRDEVTEADILRLALNGHLKLSANFVNQLYLRRCHEVRFDDEFRRLGASKISVRCIDDEDDSDKLLSTTFYDEKGSYRLELGDQVFAICGLMDLPMLGDEELYVKRQYQRLIGGPDVIPEYIYPAYVTKYMRIFQIQKGRDDNASLDSGLPQDCVLVVRTEALREFEQFISDNQIEKKPSTKPHGNAERYSGYREQILGAALSVITHWPEQCKNNSGQFEATKIARMVDTKSGLFWPETGEPPLSLQKMEREISNWISRAV